MRQALLWAAAGTGFTFLMTTLGAAMVFLLRRRSSPLLQRIFLGFAAGVMIAASVWSLLIPAIEEAEAAGGIGWVPAAGGFVLGIALMLSLDGLLPHLHNGAAQAEGLPSSFRRTTLLLLAAVVVAYQTVGTLGEWALSGSFLTAVQDFRLGVPGMLLQVVGGWAFLRWILRR